MVGLLCGCGYVNGGGMGQCVGVPPSATGTIAVFCGRRRRRQQQGARATTAATTAATALHHQECERLVVSALQPRSGACGRVPRPCWRLGPLRCTQCCLAARRVAWAAAAIAHASISTVYAPVRESIPSGGRWVPPLSTVRTSSLDRGRAALNLCLALGGPVVGHGRSAVRPSRRVSCERRLTSRGGSRKKARRATTVPSCRPAQRLMGRA